VFTNRSHRPTYREIQADRGLLVVQELLSQASKAGRAGDAQFLGQRLDEADRILRRLSRGKPAQTSNNKQIQRAKKRSFDLRQGLFPPSTLRTSPLPKKALEVKASSRSVSNPESRSSGAKKRLQTEQRASRQALKTEDKIRRAAEILRRSCYGCGARGSSTTLNLNSGRARCRKCHQKWAQRRCLRCGLPWTRKSSADARLRNCPSCGPSPKLFTVSAGAPSLGRRR